MEWEGSGNADLPEKDRRTDQTLIRAPIFSNRTEVQIKCKFAIYAGIYNSYFFHSKIANLPFEKVNLPFLWISYLLNLHFQPFINGKFEKAKLAFLKKKANLPFMKAR